MHFLRTKISFSKKSQQGQAMLFVIVAMVIALTVTLSVATRSVTNVKTSTEEANSQQAFSAAEAGVEQLFRSASTGASIIVDQKYATTKENVMIKDVSVSTISGSDLVLNNGNPVLRDDGIDLWLSTYPSYANPWIATGGKVNIYWGTSTGCTVDAALEVILVTGNVTNPVTTRYVADPCATRRIQNNFTTIPGGSGVVSGVTFSNSMTVPPSGVMTNGLLMRIIPLYASAKIGVQGRNASNAVVNFPSQGTMIQSIGASGESLRKISVYRGYPKVPDEFFANVIFVP